MGNRNHYSDRDERKCLYDRGGKCSISRSYHGMDTLSSAQFKILEKQLEEKERTIAMLEMVNQKPDDGIDVAPKTKSRNEEYELKFLVNKGYSSFIKENAYSTIEKRQGYLPLSQNLAFSQVRISKRSDRDYGLLTVKSIRHGTHRTEFQYRIPEEDTEDLLKGCGNLITKTRYCINDHGLEWTVDFFHGINEGLILAEIEFDNARSMEQFQKFNILPEWVTEDVTNDERYYNHNLVNGFGNSVAKKGGMFGWLCSKFRRT